MGRHTELTQEGCRASQLIQSLELVSFIQDLSGLGYFNYLVEIVHFLSSFLETLSTFVLFSENAALFYWSKLSKNLYILFGTRHISQVLLGAESQVLFDNFRPDFNNLDPNHLYFRDKMRVSSVELLIIWSLFAGTYTKKAIQWKPDSKPFYSVIWFWLPTQQILIPNLMGYTYFDLWFWFLEF